MRSYTWGSPEGVQAVIDSLPQRYPMTLYASDMEGLIRALSWLVDTFTCEDHPDRSNGAEHSGDGECGPDCWAERVRELLSTIAESVGVDWV